MENNYKEIFEKMVKSTQKYLEDNHLYAMILGISGGLDSTVTATICYEVEKRNPELKFYGVSLPCSSNTDEENDSAKVCMKGFCKSGQWLVENLQKEYMLMKATCSQRHLPTTIGQGNIKARLRMMYLYDLANYTKGLVMDTDNLTEHYLGFFTIHGDQGDLNPIGGLWKHEVYELAKYLHDEYYNNPLEFEGYRLMALNAAINITPTDGNGVNDLGDMGQIAPEFAHDNNIEAYTKVDDIVKTYIDCRGLHSEQYLIEMNKLYNKYSVKTVEDIVNRIIRTEYKRKRLPIVPDITKART
jgi:NAD+ synthetase